MLVINLLLFSLCTATVFLLVITCTALSSLVIIVAIIVLITALTLFWKKKRKRQEHEIGGKIRINELTDFYSVFIVKEQAIRHNPAYEEGLF